MSNTIRNIVFILVLALPISSLAQEEKKLKQTQVVPADSSQISLEATRQSVVIKPIVKNPKKAAWLSAIIPGAGQVYNGKIWKVPIIYGAFATTSYLIIGYNNRYQEYKKIYNELKEEGGSSAELDRAKEGMIFYTRYRDLNVIVSIVIYALNIIDASVDAHLSDFDVEDNLSIAVQPTAFRYGDSQAVGLTCTINF